MSGIPATKLPCDSSSCLREPTSPAGPCICALGRGKFRHHWSQGDGLPQIARDPVENAGQARNSRNSGVDMDEPLGGNRNSVGFEKGPGPCSEDDNLSIESVSMIFESMPELHFPITRPF